jgi:hypothetical protein
LRRLSTTFIQQSLEKLIVSELSRNSLPFMGPKGSLQFSQEPTENRVVRRICGPKRDEVIGEWRKLHKRGFIFCIHPKYY